MSHPILVNTTIYHMCPKTKRFVNALNFVGPITANENWVIALISMQVHFQNYSLAAKKIVASSTN